MRLTALLVPLFFLAAPAAALELRGWEDGEITIHRSVPGSIDAYIHAVTFDRALRSYLEQYAWQHTALIDPDASPQARADIRAAMAQTALCLKERGGREGAAWGEEVKRRVLDSPGRIQRHAIAMAEGRNAPAPASKRRLCLK